MAEEIDASCGPSEPQKNEDPIWSPLGVVCLICLGQTFTGGHACQHCGKPLERGILMPDGRRLSPQQAAIASDADELLFGGGAGGGKRLANDTPVPVPLCTSLTGFKDHGDLEPGDMVYGIDGRPVRVDAVTPIVCDVDAFEVRFESGETIVADGDHLWATWTYRDRRRVARSGPEGRSKRKATRTDSRRKLPEELTKPAVSRVVTQLNRDRVWPDTDASYGIRQTRDIRDTLFVRGTRVNHSVDVAQPIQGAELDLPIEPYLFGLWLGDGWSNAPTIGMGAPDWADISKHVPESSHESVDVRPPRQVPFLMKRFAPMWPSLRQLGVVKQKHIPAIYKRASHRQRVALLQGLLDTDGSCGVNRQIELGFTNKRLTEDALELVSSLGIKASLTSKVSASGKTHYRFKFVAPFQAFRLQRKADRQRGGDLSHRPTTRSRYIVSVEPVPSVPMRCIKVSSRDGLYLVGRSFIPTHNSDLIIGLAITQHHNSVIFRREFTQFRGAEGLWERSKQIIGLRGEANESRLTWMNLPGGRALEFGAIQHEKNRRKYMGRPHDLKAFDELPQMPESLFRFLIGWLRTTYPNQRTRVVGTSNPPQTSDEEWIIRYWAPWLDPQHPNPAKPGELRWFVSVNGKDREVEDGDPRVLHGKPGCPHPITPQSTRCPQCDGDVLRPKSRTFIPSSVEDNPFYMRTGYADQLKALPEPLRSQLLTGNFQAAIKDDDWQVIPTAWILAAQQRWRPDGWKDEKGEPIPVSQVGVDPSRGGSAEFVIAKCHGRWVATLTAYPATAAPDGKAGGALVARAVGSKGIRVQIDIGGAAGSSVYDYCKDHEHYGLRAIALDGSRATKEMDRTRKFGFINKRALWHWRMREALDPKNGLNIALPPDPQMRADLCAPRWFLRSGRIGIEEKPEIMKRLGRSPDRGEGTIYAVVSDGVDLASQAVPTAVGQNESWDVGHSYPDID